MKKRKKPFFISQEIVDGVTFKLFAIALLYIDDVEDDNISHLKSIEELTKEKIRDFFQKKLERL